MEEWHLSCISYISNSVDREGDEKKKRDRKEGSGRGAEGKRQRGVKKSREKTFKF